MPRSWRRASGPVCCDGPRGIILWSGPVSTSWVPLPHCSSSAAAPGWHRWTLWMVQERPTSDHRESRSPGLAHSVRRIIIVVSSPLLLCSNGAKLRHCVKWEMLLVLLLLLEHTGCSSSRGIQTPLRQASFLVSCSGRQTAPCMCVHVRLLTALLESQVFLALIWLYFLYLF